MALRLYNSLSRKKEDFVPFDPANVRMYVCGPTVYDFAHIGNARPVIVFDVLYRLLRHIYGDNHVKYVRNITDVDDKIMARAVDENIDINDLTRATAAQFHADVAALGCLEPDVEPRATDHIPQMIAMIGKLIAKGSAYAADGHVLFDVPAWQPYGELSGRSTDEMIAGARVEVAPYKKSPMDFVLWKPSADNQPGWDSPWGRGRPGWHIECSAMSEEHLGKSFDIHGGGIDLTFPHHENEIAQSRCVHGTDVMAKVWMHNGFLQVEGEKMSKSLGNFFTIQELLETDKFGGRMWPGPVLRLAMLMTHYHQPIDWTVSRLEEAYALWRRWGRHLDRFPTAVAELPDDLVETLTDDLNTPALVRRIHSYALSAAGPGLKGGPPEPPTEADLEAQVLAAGRLRAGCQLIGLDFSSARSARKEDMVRSLVDSRVVARKAKDFAEADRLRDELVAMGVILKDGPEGTTWEIAR